MSGTSSVESSAICIETCKTAKIPKNQVVITENQTTHIMSIGKNCIFGDDYGNPKVLNQIVGTQFDNLSEIKANVEVEKITKLVFTKTMQYNQDDAFIVMFNTRNISNVKIQD